MNFTTSFPVKEYGKLEQILGDTHEEKVGAEGGKDC